MVTVSFIHAVISIILILLFFGFYHKWVKEPSPIKYTMAPSNLKSSLITYAAIPSKYNPIYDRSYRKSEQVKYLDIVPRRAYYDNRRVFSVHRSIVFILAEVKDSSRDSIIACEVNGYQSSFSLLKENIDWVRATYPGFTHSTVLIQCLGIPRRYIQNRTIVKVIYKNKNDIFYTRVETEQPLVIKTQDDWTVDTIPFKGRGSVVVCTALFSHPPRFNEWLKYQRAIGVDLVHLDVDPSFFKNATSVYPFLQEALDSGFARMEMWEEFGDKIFYHAQLMKYQACGMQYAGVYEYGIFCDYDDFLNPVIPKHKNIHYYLERYFTSKRIGSLHVPWRHFQCAPIEEVYKTLPDGNLTASLSGTKAYWRGEPKSIHRLHALEFINIHNARSLVKGYRVEEAKRNELYFGHLRIDEKICAH